MTNSRLYVTQLLALFPSSSFHLCDIWWVVQIKHSPQGAQQLSSVAQIKWLQECHVRDFLLAKILTSQAAPKLTFSMILEGIQPTLDSYLEARPLAVALLLKNSNATANWRR
jgi:hypothetical protein